LKQEGEKRKVILFTSKKSTPCLFKALSKDFKGKLVFGEIRDSEKELIEKFGIQKFPAILAVTDGENFKGDLYQGVELKKDQITKFLREQTFQQTPPKVSKGGFGKLVALKPDDFENGHCGSKGEIFKFKIMITLCAF
jgi:hypothetical protein